MSNLWKALRDVSRDVDPAIGFESAATRSGGEGAVPDASHRVNDQPSAPSGRPTDPDPDADAAPSPIADATHSQLNPFLPRPPARPAAPHRGPASSEPASGPLPEGDEPKPRLAPLQSPLRRRLPNSGMGLDSTGGLTRVVRPLFDAAPGNEGVTPAAGTAWNAESRPSSPVTLAPAPLLGAPLSYAPGTGPLPAAPLSYGPGPGPSPEPLAAPPISWAAKAPNVAEVGAARGQSPRWQPGDDDVLPTDGHKGARRPRLRERLPW